jgi:hypothetical protein
MRSNAIFSESKNGRTLLFRKSDAVRAFLSGKTNVGMGINRYLLINLSNIFNVSDVTGVLTKKETRVWSFDLSMSFLFFLGLFQGRNLKLSEDAFVFGVS